MSEMNYDVVLNRNAGRVTPALINQLATTPEGRLHLTESLFHSRSPPECVEKGTEIFLLAEMEPSWTLSADCMSFPKGPANRWQLGTGNALAYWLIIEAK